MNLFEMLDGYKTSPKNEIRKIATLLKERVSFHGRTVWELLCISFDFSDLKKVETDLDAFYKNLIVKNPIYDEMDDEEITVLQYRFLCELIYNLLVIGERNNTIYSSANEIVKLVEIIKNGLELCGYKIVSAKGNYVTKKIDIHAESVAATNTDYKDYIFDYLISKTEKEKEQSLLNLSNKLEATKPVDGYTKHTRDYIQLLRHPDERKKNIKYSWFYRDTNYSDNLEKLFRILLTYIAHLNSYTDLNEFEKNCTERS